MLTGEFLDKRRRAQTLLRLYAAEKHKCVSRMRGLRYPATRATVTRLPGAIPFFFFFSSPLRVIRKEAALENFGWMDISALGDPAASRAWSHFGPQPFFTESHQYFIVQGRLTLLSVRPNETLLPPTPLHSARTHAASTPPTVSYLRTLAQFDAEWQMKVSGRTSLLIVGVNAVQHSHRLSLSRFCCWFPASAGGSPPQTFSNPILARLCLFHFGAWCCFIQRMKSKLTMWLSSLKLICLFASSFHGMNPELRAVRIFLKVFRARLFSITVEKRNHQQSSVRKPYCCAKYICIHLYTIYIFMYIISIYMSALYAFSHI